MADLKTIIQGIKQRSAAPPVSEPMVKEQVQLGKPKGFDRTYEEFPIDDPEVLRQINSGKAWAEGLPQMTPKLSPSAAALFPQETTLARTPNPVEERPDIRDSLAESIIRMEGYFPGSRAYRNHNPGNLKDPSGKIWPDLPHDDQGFPDFGTHEAGKEALLRDLDIKIKRGMTLQELIYMYAPPNENKTKNYLSFVAKQLGIPIDVDLRTIAGTGGGAAGGSNLQRIIQGIMAQRRPADEVDDLAGKLKRSLLVPTTALGRGFATAVLGTAAAAEPIGAMTGLKPLEQAGKKVSEFKKEYFEKAPPGLGMEEFEGKTIGDDWSLLANPKYMANLMFEGIGSVAGFFLPGSATGKLTAAAMTRAMPKLIATRPVLAKAAQVLAGTAAGAAMESTVNSTDNYVEALNAGLPQEKALEVFSDTFSHDLPVTAVTNLAGLYSPRLSKTWAKILHGLVDSALEGGQEVWQGDVSHEALSKALIAGGMKPPERAGRIEEFLGGSLGGGAVSAGRALIEGRAPKKAPVPEVEATETFETEAETETPPPETVTPKPETMPAIPLLRPVPKKLFDQAVAFARGKGEVTPETMAAHLGITSQASQNLVKHMIARNVLDLYGQYIGPKEAPSDLKDKAGVPSQKREGETPLEAGPVEGAGTETTGTGGVLQEEGEVDRWSALEADRLLVAKPWQMRVHEWGALAADIFDEQRKPVSERGREWHKGKVRDALAAGEPVPPEVLADYPDLVPKAAPVAAAAGAERAPKTEPTRGRKVEILVPGEKTTYYGDYELREADDVHQSHNPFNFDKNANYEYVNDHNYKDPEEAELIVKRSTPELFNATYVTNTSATAEHGPPVVEDRGNVLGGNSRVMILKRIFQNFPRLAASYKQALRDNAALFGYSPEDVDKFTNPIIVRNIHQTAKPQDAITNFNKKGAGALKVGAQAVTDGRRLSPSTINLISGALGEAGESGSLADAIRGEGGAQIIMSMIKDGIISEQEKRAYIDKDNLTPEGKIRIARALVGRMFTSAEEFDRLGAEERNKLERIAPQVLRVEDRPEWRLTEKVREALDYLGFQRAHGIQDVKVPAGIEKARAYAAPMIKAGYLTEDKFNSWIKEKGGKKELTTEGRQQLAQIARKFQSDDLAKQGDVGEKTKFSDDAIALAMVMRDTPNRATAAFRKYANEAEHSRPGAPAILFDPLKPDNAFKAAFREGESSGFDQAADEAAQRLSDRAKGDQLNIGLDPTVLRDIALVTARAIKRQAMTFGQWYPRALKTFGEGIRKVAGRVWKEAKRFASDESGELFPSKEQRIAADRERQGGMFGEEQLEEVSEEVKRERDKLEGERLTAQFKAPIMPGEEKQKRKKPAPPKQASMFEEAPAEEEQGGLFDQFMKDESGTMRLPKVPEGAKTVADFFRPLLSRIAKEGGDLGKRLAKLIERTGDVGEVAAGIRVAKLKDLGIQDLDRSERFHLVDVLEGRAKAASDKIGKIARGVRSILDEIAAEAEEAGVLVKRRIEIKPGDPVPITLTAKQRAELDKGNSVVIRMWTPFKAREDFYHHVIRGAGQLKGGQIRTDVIENMVRIKAAPDKKAATALLDEYIQFIEKGGRQNALIEYMVKSGQAKNAAEAHKMLLRHRRQAVRRQGSLEFAREINLPFYDPDPLRVLPRSIADQSIRLKQVAGFGQFREKIDAYQHEILAAGGNAEFVKHAVDLMIGYAQEPDTAAAKISRGIRAFEALRLGPFSSLRNLTQGALNTLLAGDLRAALAGVKGSFTKGGQRFAVESGATLESIINESLRHAGQEGQLISKYLKATGFVASENRNRVIAAIGGANYAKRMAEHLQKNPHDEHTARRLADLGLDPKQIAMRRGLSAHDVLIAAKKFSDLTQFRSRAQDLPEFASHEMGKMFFQFKSYIYGQTRLIEREFLDELRAKNFGRATRTMLLLGTAFPAGSWIVTELVNALRGKKEDHKDLRRYLDEVARAGAGGMLGDLIQASQYGGVAGWFMGPGMSDIADTIEQATRFGTADDKEKALRYLYKNTFRRMPLLGQLFYYYAYPQKADEDEGPLEELRKSRRERFKSAAGGR